MPSEAAQHKAEAIRAINECPDPVCISLRTPRGAIHWGDNSELEAERQAAREAMHLANGTAELAMKHRDIAEAAARALKEALNEAVEYTKEYLCGVMNERECPEDVQMALGSFVADIHNSTRTALAAAEKAGIHGEDAS